MNLRTLLIPVFVTLSSAACLAGKPASTTADLLQQRSFQMLWNTADPDTGLVADAVDFKTGKPVSWSSIAGVGFMLASLPIGVERGWVPLDDARQRAKLVLTNLLETAPHQHGWLYHFIDMHTLARAGASEVSSMDTALLVAGALVAGQYFDGDVRSLADDLYHRVDFPWMLTDGGAKPHARTFNHAWTDEHGFSPYRYNQYCEIMVLYQLGIGSPTHPVPPDCWEAFDRPTSTYDGVTTFAIGPLFTHEFSHLFIDFRNQRDPLGYNYFTASVNAVRIDRAYCIQRSATFRTFDKNIWGLSACLGPNGYTAYGRHDDRDDTDGTVAPWAAAAAIMFCPDLTESALDDLREKYGDKVFGAYGLVESFNIDRGWFSPRITTLDAGAAVIAIENHRSGLIWKSYMAQPDVRQSMERIGFVADERDDFYIRPAVAQNTESATAP
ncbi:MAG: hypothetical protein GC162_05750 [Planctomycetes bacterium]|nr:hypothetical protein [Planctomycetota bacterium]